MELIVEQKEGGWKEVWWCCAIVSTAIVEAIVKAEA
jgi:hypothetical protein